MKRHRRALEAAAAVLLALPFLLPLLVVLSHSFLSGWELRQLMAGMGSFAQERFLPLHIPPVEVSLHQYKAMLLERPEILRTLDALHESGHRLCLVSNADVIDTLHWRESPLAGRMDETVFSHLVHARKPDEAIYRIALERTGADPACSAFIGDAPRSRAASS